MRGTMKIQEKIISNIIENIQKDPQGKIPELIDLIIEMDTKKNWESHYDVLRNISKDKNNFVYKMIEHIEKNCSDKLVNKLITTFLVNSVLHGNVRHNEIKEMYNISVPKMIDIKYDGIIDNEITYLIAYETLSKIVKDGKDLGCYVYNISCFKHIQNRDILKLALKNPECIFILELDFDQIDRKFVASANYMQNIIFTINASSSNMNNIFEDNLKKFGECIKVLQDEKSFYGIKMNLALENIDDVFKSNYLKKIVQKGALFNIYTYDVLALFNEDIDFEKINSNILEIQEKYPILFIKNCEYLESKIEIYVNECQTIKVLDIDDVIENNSYRHAILDVLHNKSLNKKYNNVVEDKQLKKELKDTKNNILTFMSNFTSKVFGRKQENLDKLDLKAS